MTQHLKRFLILCLLMWLIVVIPSSLAQDALIIERGVLTPQGGIAYVEATLEAGVTDAWTIAVNQGETVSVFAMGFGIVYPNLSAGSTLWRDDRRGRPDGLVLQ
jgi:hypothetical protein